MTRQDFHHQLQNIRTNPGPCSTRELLGLFHPTGDRLDPGTSPREYLTINDSVICLGFLGDPEEELWRTYRLASDAFHWFDYQNWEYSAEKADLSRPDPVAGEIEAA